MEDAPPPSKKPSSARCLLKNMILFGDNLKDLRNKTLFPVLGYVVSFLMFAQNFRINANMRSFIISFLIRYPLIIVSQNGIIS